MQNENQPETEQDAILSEAKRRYRARQTSRGLAAQTSASSPSQSNTPAITVSIYVDKPSSSK